MFLAVSGVGNENRDTTIINEMGGQSHKTQGGNLRSQTTGWGTDPNYRVATLCIVKRIDEQ